MGVISLGQGQGPKASGYVGFRVVLESDWDSGKENGHYYLGFRV